MKRCLAAAISSLLLKMHARSAEHAYFLGSRLSDTWLRCIGTFRLCICIQDKLKDMLFSQKYSNQKKGFSSNRIQKGILIKLCFINNLLKEAHQKQEHLVPVQTVAFR